MSRLTLFVSDDGAAKSIKSRFINAAVTNGALTGRQGAFISIDTEPAPPWVEDTADFDLQARTSLVTEIAIRHVLAERGPAAASDLPTAEGITLEQGETIYELAAISTEDMKAQLEATFGPVSVTPHDDKYSASTPGHATFMKAQWKLSFSGSDETDALRNLFMGVTQSACPGSITEDPLEHGHVYNGRGEEVIYDPSKKLRIGTPEGP